MIPAGLAGSFVGGMTVALRTFSGQVGRTGSLATGVASVGLLSLLVVFSGCGLDLSGLLDNTTGPTDATAADLVGTWTGILTAGGASNVYQFTIDAAGSYVAWDNSTGTATTTSNGKVTITYVTNGYTVSLHGTMNAEKTKIVMTSSSWTGPATGSEAFTGTLIKSGSSSGSDGFLLTDLVGTWSGTVTENGLAQNYQFTVDSAGAFTTSGGLSGTAAISTTGTVIFSYSSGGFTGTFQGTMDSGKTQITMSVHTWTGASSGTAGLTGTLAKS